jgi:hypothetical protein
MRAMHGVAMHGGGGEVGVSELFWFVVPLRHSGGGGGDDDNWILFIERQVAKPYAVRDKRLGVAPALWNRHGDPARSRPGPGPPVPGLWLIFMIIMTGCVWSVYL